MVVRIAAPLLAVAALAACQTTAAPDNTPALMGKAAEGKQLADALCSSCHAVAVGEVSPNPQAPTFPNIANMSGLTEATLADFLREVARYRTGVLRCDPAVADLIVSGVYPIKDTDAILQSLARALPVQVHSVTPYWVTVSARP